MLSNSEKECFEKKKNKLARVGLTSTATNAEIRWSMKYYDMEGIWARALRQMRPHVFNFDNLRIPQMVLSPKLLFLGVGAALHPYIKSILKLYNVAPIQLSPNFYKLAWSLFIMYHDLKLGVPSMRKFSFFFQHHKIKS